MAGKKACNYDGLNPVNNLAINTYFSIRKKSFHNNKNIKAKLKPALHVVTRDIAGKKNQILFTSCSRQKFECFDRQQNVSSNSRRDQPLPQVTLLTKSMQNFRQLLFVRNRMATNWTF
jgi:hypothetical protein